MNAFSDIDVLLRVISREKDILRFLFLSRKAPSLRREQALENFLSQDTRRLEYLLEHGVIREAEGLLEQHGLLVIHGIHRTEGNRAVAVGYEDSVAGNAGGALVSIGKSLYVGEKHQCQQGLLEDVFLSVYETAGIFQGLPDLVLIVQRSVIGAGHTNATLANTFVNVQFLDQKRMKLLNAAE
jgi:hypothetical protein